MYSEKQWGKKAEDLPAFLIKRLPLRFSFDNNYYNDKYQGLPEGGYNKLSEALLKNIETRVNANYFDDRDQWNSVAEKIVFIARDAQHLKELSDAARITARDYTIERHAQRLTSVYDTVTEHKKRGSVFT